MSTERYFAHGKILISGEYAVLKGAKALALPTLKGQELSVTEGEDEITWKSLDHEGNEWFNARFNLELSIISSWDEQRAKFIQILLKKAIALAGVQPRPSSFCSFLEFPAAWGLGSSSTLTYLLASHFQIDPFALFFSTQNGSGYDVACAGSEGPIIYQLKNKKPEWVECNIPKIFREASFIYLNKKQDSRREVTRFNKLIVSRKQIEEISSLTDSFIQANTREDLISVMQKHEALLSSILGQPGTAEQNFADYQGAVKSLGAWGGDFVMAIGEDTENYFRERGFRHILTFGDLFGSLSDK